MNPYSTHSPPPPSPPPPQNASTAVVADGESNVFQLIQAHQVKATRLPPLQEIRTLLNHTFRGVLSTFSQKYENYPSGSMVDFACDDSGSPILALSRMAVHTQDLSANPKCSLLIVKDSEDMTNLVITMHGDAESVSEEDRESIRTAYFSKHPSASRVDFGDFQFMRVEPRVVRYVSGVATASFASRVSLLLSKFSKEDYRAATVDPVHQFSVPISFHMNKDHAQDTKLIVQHSTSIPVDSAHMLDVDSLGFNVKAGYQGDTFNLRIPFPTRAVERKDVKTLIIKMLQAAGRQDN